MTAKLMMIKAKGVDYQHSGRRLAAEYIY